MHDESHAAMIRRIFITSIALLVLSASLNADTPAANLAWYGNWGDSLANAYAKWPNR